MCQCANVQVCKDVNVSCKVGKAKGYRNLSISSFLLHFKPYVKIKIQKTWYKFVFSQLQPENSSVLWRTSESLKAKWENYKQYNKITTMELRVARRYRLGPKIGAGNNAEVYAGTNVRTGEEVALKLERLKGRTKQLENEYRVYLTLRSQGT
jgi:hypothetical protein